jgi:hypothetical protein
MGSRGAKASVYGELQYLVVWLGYHTEAVSYMTAMLTSDIYWA